MATTTICNGFSRRPLQAPRMSRSVFAYNHTSRIRYFSTTPRAQNAIVDILTFMPNLTMTSLHYAGLPWYAVIPATAVIFRGIVGFPLAKDTQERMRLSNVISPLMQVSVKAQQLQQILKKRLQPSNDGPANAQWGMAAHKADYDMSSMKVKTEFSSRYKTGLLNRTSLMQFSVLLICAEAIRVRIGSTHGLLGLTFEAFGNVLQRIGLFEAFGNVLQRIGLSHTSSSVADATELVKPDLSMTVEGLPWCQDLTVADPTGTLPVMVMSAMVIDTMIRSSRSTARNWQEWLTLFNGWDFVRITLAWCIWLGGDAIPAGILLYIFSSLVIGKAVTVALTTLRPIPPSLRPCRIGVNHSLTPPKRPTST